MALLYHHTHCSLVPSRKWLTRLYCTVHLGLEFMLPGVVSSCGQCWNYLIASSIKLQLFDIICHFRKCSVYILRYKERSAEKSRSWSIGHWSREVYSSLVPSFLWTGNKNCFLNTGKNKILMSDNIWVWEVRFWSWDFGLVTTDRSCTVWILGMGTANVLFVENLACILCE